MAGLFGLTGRLRRGIPLAAMAAMLVVAVNHVKIRFRSEPLYPSDVAFLRDAHLLVDSVGPGAVLGLVGTSQAEQDYTLLQYDMAVGAGHGTATAFSVPAP